MVVSHPKPQQRPHPTYLSPQGKAAIAAHREVLRKRREQHAAAVQSQLFLQAVMRDLRQLGVKL